MGFMRGYEEYLTDEMIEKLERKANETNAIKEDSFESLEKQYTYLEIDGVEPFDVFAHPNVQMKIFRKYKESNRLHT